MRNPNKASLAGLVAASLLLSGSDATRCTNSPRPEQAHRRACGGFRG